MLLPQSYTTENNVSCRCNHLCVSSIKSSLERIELVLDRSIKSNVNTIVSKILQKQYMMSMFNTWTRSKRSINLIYGNCYFTFDIRYFTFDVYAERPMLCIKMRICLISFEFCSRCKIQTDFFPVSKLRGEMETTVSNSIEFFEIVHIKCKTTRNKSIGVWLPSNSRNMVCFLYFLLCIFLIFNDFIFYLYFLVTNFQNILHAYRRYRLRQN